MPQPQMRWLDRSGSVISRDSKLELQEVAAPEKQTRGIRNRYAQSHGGPGRNQSSDWKDLNPVNRSPAE